MGFIALVVSVPSSRASSGQPERGAFGVYLSLMASIALFQFDREDAFSSRSLPYRHLASVAECQLDHVRNIGLAVGANVFFHGDFLSFSNIARRL